MSLKGGLAKKEGTTQIEPSRKDSGEKGRALTDLLLIHSLRAERKEEGE